MKGDKISSEIILAEGENIIENYNCFVLSKPTGKAKVVLTNKRFIYVVDDKNRNVDKFETQLSNVCGISAKTVKKSILNYLIVGILLLLSGIVIVSINLNSLFKAPIFLLYVQYIIGGALILVGATLVLFKVILGKKKKFVFSVIINTSLTKIINIADSVKTINQDIVNMSIGKPTAEGLRMFGELGAKILEIQAKN